MNRLSDNKLAKLKNLQDQGVFWYITKQNLVFRDLCFMAKILDAWNDSKEENYQSFFDRHKTLPEFGELAALTAHRATKNCEYLGLTETSDKYSSERLTPFYFALKELCKGDFNKLSLYPKIIDKQLERIFIDSNTNSTYTVNFQICPFMFLFKILLLIGDITKSYKISITEFKLFVATAQNWDEYFEVVESILRYRTDNEYKEQCNKNTSKVSDVRYNVLAQNHSQLDVVGNDISIKDGEIKNVRRKVAEYELSDKIQSAEDIYNADINFSDKPRQQIFFGAPGTGKSHTINEYTDGLPKGNVFRTTFHPDSDYSTFVGNYKPTKVPKPIRNVAGDKVKEFGNEVYEDAITYEFIQQAFTKAYIRAWQTNEPVFLVIEEINRGNCAQIFGDLFQLLDRKGNVSEYPIKPDTDLGKYIHEQFKANGCVADKNSTVFKGEELVLPANLYIWATMNTSDQSLFPIDSAFKRRWEWRYIKIAKPTGLDWKLEDGTDWYAFIKQINRIIDRMTNSADKQLGYFFAKADEAGVIKYDRFVAKVCFYLWNDIFKIYAMDDMETDLFKYKYIDHEDEDKEKIGKLTFTEFFDENGKVVDDIVKPFIANVMKWNDNAKQD